MANDTETLLGLRVAVREGQDAGALPCESCVGRRFQVMAMEIAVPVLRDLVNALSLEGLPAHLLMAMNEAVPFVRLEIDTPSTRYAFTHQRRRMKLSRAFVEACIRSTTATDTCPTAS